MKKVTLLMLALVMAFSLALAPASNALATTSEPITESDSTSCHDGIDNDENGLKDEGELSCAIFFQVNEDTDLTCHDDIDNNENGLKDQGELSCAPFFIINEDTDLTCHDDIDNNENGLKDQGELSCAPFFLIVEDDATECHDGIDNDEDGLIDQGELSCGPFYTTATSTATTTPPTTTTDNGGGRTGASGGGGFSSGGGNVTVIFPGATPAGTVLGASTDDAAANCSISFKKYMKKGQSGIDVKGLQAFLNSEVGSKLPITGHFGNQTFAAVKAFQLKYAAEILGPWVSVGKLKNNSAATGYVYKTTLRKMNLIRCATLNTPPIPASELN